MKKAQYNGCVIEYSVNTATESESDLAKEFIDGTGVGTLIFIHDIISPNDDVNVIMKALLTFCREIGDQIIIYDFGITTDEIQKEYDTRHKAAPASKYTDILKLKQRAAILEFLGFISISHMNETDDFRETYVYNNGSIATGFLAQLDNWNCGSLISAYAVEEDPADYHSFTDAFGKYDDKRRMVAKALMSSISNECELIELLGDFCCNVQLTDEARKRLGSAGGTKKASSF